MAVYAPGDDPSDVSSGGFPSWLANLPASIQAQLMRVGNYANPVSSANAAPASIAASDYNKTGKIVEDSVSQPPNPLTNPTPVDPRLTGGGPPVPASLTSNAAQIVPGGGSSGGGGASGGGAFPVGPPGSQPQPVPPVMGPPQSPTPWFTGSNTPYAPNPAAGAPTPPIRPAVARGGRKPAATIPASATASVPAAGSPWVTKDAQNQDWSGGALARGGARQMGMLDLSKLFGRS